MTVNIKSSGDTIAALSIGDPRCDGGHCLTAAVSAAALTGHVNGATQSVGVSLFDANGGTTTLVIRGRRRRARCLEHATLRRRYCRRSRAIIACHEHGEMRLVQRDEQSFMGGRGLVQRRVSAD